MSKDKDYFISFSEAAFALGITDKDFLEWVRQDRPEIGVNYINKKAIRKSYLEKCIFKNDYLKKLEKSFQVENQEIENEIANKIVFYQKERKYLIDNYLVLIADLIELHKKYEDTAVMHGIESPVLAAYLLFSRAIAILSCLCENIKQGFYYAGSMLREIDETLDVALYFILSKDKDTGKNDLMKWYRVGFSPSHSKCRKTIAEATKNKTFDFEFLMSTIYGKKSAFIHPTFHSIRDCCIISFENERVLLKNLCYGISLRQERLYELAHFARSSIWTCFQQFLFIFVSSMPLNQSDIDYLVEYDRIFREWDRKLNW